MIATHNIKVNGRWYAAGERIPEEKPETGREPDLIEITQGNDRDEIVAEVTEAEPTETETVKPKRTNPRRKKTDE